MTHCQIIIPSIMKTQMIDVYCPTGAVTTKEYLDTAPRVATLEGRKVGLLWNGKPNGDKFLDRVAEVLEEKYGDIEVIKFWEMDADYIAYEYKKDTLDHIAKNVDVVVAASGD